MAENLGTLNRIFRNSRSFARGLVLVSGTACVTAQLLALVRRVRCASASPAAFPPQLTLYQYRSCPYCCKTRAFLDYYGLGYQAVEVHPFFKKEIKFSEQKKVPILLANDEELHDSSLIVSVLLTSMVNGDSIANSLSLYPEMSYQDSKGRPQVERANKYFIMHPTASSTQTDGPPDSQLIGARREEREWREWVDSTLVKTLPPNIYRTLSESLHSFGHFTAMSNFSTFERLVAKYLGSVGMYFLGQMLAKKHKLDPDVRQSLYKCCDKWMEAVGKHRRFMGGEEPNLADLAVYGVLSTVEGLPTFTDVAAHTAIGPWYQAVGDLVKKQHGRSKNPFLSADSMK